MWASYRDGQNGNFSSFQCGNSELTKSDQSLSEYATREGNLEITLRVPMQVCLDLR